MKKIWATIAFLLLSMPASAALLNFDLTDGTNSISFQLDENPVVSSSNEFRFRVTGVSVAVNGAMSSRDLAFSTADLGGEFEISGDLPGSRLVSQANFAPGGGGGGGAPLFAGTTANPAFSPGTFKLSHSGLFADYSTNFDLTISAVPVPPAAWLFASAIGALGYVRRKLSA